MKPKLLEQFQNCLKTVSNTVLFQFRFVERAV